MVQRILSLALTLGVILWIVLTYVPDSLLPLPIIRFSGSGGLLAGLTVACLVAFVAIQTYLVRSTVRGVDPDHQPPNTRSPFRLNRNAELFWTVLPLVMTLVLAWASYGLWINLTQP